MKDEKKQISGVKVKYRKSEVISGYLFILPSLVIFITFMIIPIFMGLYISLTDYDGFKTMNFVGLQNYAAMFKDSYFLVSFKNNIVYTEQKLTVHCHTGSLETSIDDHLLNYTRIPLCI